MIDSLFPNRTRHAWIAAFALIILAFLALGYLAAQSRAGIADRELRAELLQQALALARTIDAQEVKSLSFTAQDKDRPEFTRLRDQLRAYHTTFPCRGIYTLALRQGELIFGPESYAETDPQASPPGTVFREPTALARALFQTRRAFTEGPVADEYGTFVTAFAPVLDPRTGEVLLAVGLDVEVAEWRSILTRARLTAILGTLLPAAILLAGLFVLWRRSGLPAERRTRLRYAEVYLTAAFGLALTLLASLAMYDLEVRERRESFRQLAQAKANLVLSTFYNLRYHKLDALARFFEGSQYVDQREFQVFAAPMAWRHPILSVEWILAVPASRKSTLERQARAAGQADFAIWQRGAGGRRESASGRPVYYPVWFVAPLQGNEAILGYDLGAEPVTIGAMEAARATGLPAAAEPLTLGPEKDGGGVLLLFHPVFSGGRSVRAQQGFTLVRVRLQPLLQSALFRGSENHEPLALDLYQLQAGQPPRFLVTSSASGADGRRTARPDGEEPSLAQSDFSALFPLFIFGKSYALFFYPPPAFLAANPLWYGLATALAGLILTALLSAVVSFIVRRRANLETLVLARTAALKESEENYRDLVENINDLICTHDLEGNILSANRASLKTLGYEREEIIGQNIRAFLAPALRPEFDEYLTAIARDGAARGLMLVQTRSGEKLIWEYDNTLRTEGLRRPIVRGLARDVSERHRAERALRESERRLSQIIEFLPDATFAINVEGKVTAWNRAMEELTGIKAAQMLGQGDYAYALPFFGVRRPLIIDLLLSPDENIARSYRFFREEKGRIISESYVADFRGRGPAWFWNNATVLYGPGGQVIGAIESIREITDRKRADEERERMEAKLAQAEKMEAVGRLAGGVAHDFNNMLNVIVGYAGLALMKLDFESPLYHNIQEIIKAGERSAELVRQLLAFARRQTISPQVLDLNETIAGMLKMLRRLIGEDIDLCYKPSSNLWPVNMDPSQVDQILANLTVNARDAISGVGKITIETANVDIDENYCRNNEGFVPGQYVLMAVSDDGCGMDEKTKEQLFEPFFTTRPVGKGTGLGLATVYGIVKQNNGFINVYSEPSLGSTFKIYLPRYSRGEAAEIRLKPAAMLPGGTETVLLVEDEGALLEIGREMLAHLGYKVLSAGSPIQALQLAQEYQGGIDLLITDVIMPLMNGRDLCHEIAALRPGIKCLYMSGYTADVIAHHGVLDEGVCFLQKPFSLETLAREVREALGLGQP